MTSLPVSPRIVDLDASAPGRPMPRQRERLHSGMGTARLEVLRTTGLLDDATREFWDGLTALSASLLSVPLAMMTLVQDDETLTMSTGGRARCGQRWTTELEAGVRRHMSQSLAPLVVEDGQWDELRRKADGSGVRSWITWPLVTSDGSVAGAFTVFDVCTRSWTHAELTLLGVFARSASAQLSLLAASDAERAARDDLQAVRESERRVEQRLQRLASVALELLRAEEIEDLTEIVVNRGLPVLGADGGAVVVRDDDRFAAAVSDRLGPQVQSAYRELPLDDPLPAAYVARTGKRLVLPTRAAGLAFTPAMGPLYDSSHRHAWVFTPLWVGNRLLGSLAASWAEERDFSDDDLTVLDAFAAQCAQALERIRLTKGREETAVRGQRLSEALQRSLLTQPATRRDLDIGCRYLPAVHEAHVGGDWFDAFECSSGATVLAVGDVAGHDRNAAAAMAQLRNLLRGLAFDSDDPPAVLLSRLDRAALALGLDALATAVVVRLEPQDMAGGRRMLWSSAGHVPPLLRLADGSVHALVAEEDLLLGLDGYTPRHDHKAALPDHSTLLLYTDGLVERRGEDLDVGVQRLVDVVSGLAGGADAVCDRVLRGMLPGPQEDDVALLVVQPRVTAGST
ncbi:MAG: SpoIIE family protein phosphatase [Frankiaceae bacterium]|nr:SpoIIE family protein phosphatase [Frankiaceae bacterium]